jgi:hypothetical protein
MSVRLQVINNTTGVQTLGDKYTDFAFSKKCLRSGSYYDCLREKATAGFANYSKDHAMSSCTERLKYWRSNRVIKEIIAPNLSVDYKSRLTYKELIAPSLSDCSLFFC